MSVMSLLAATCLAMLLMLSVAVPAQAAQLIRHAKDLDRDPKIYELGKAYDALTAAQYLFDQCDTKIPKYYPADKKAYIAQKLPTLTKQYQNSYQQKYVEKVKAPATATFLEDVAQSIAARQQKTVNNMALFLKQNHCGSGQLKPVLKFVDDLHAQDTGAKPHPVETEPATIDPFAPPQ